MLATTPETAVGETVTANWGTEHERYNGRNEKASALTALSNSVQAQTAVECANAFDRLSSWAKSTGPLHAGWPQEKATFNACAEIVERVLKENSCTKFDPGGVYSAAGKIAKEHPTATTVLFSWEHLIKSLVVPRKDRC